MPEGVGIPKPPVLERATLEQALRWIELELPPLLDDHERIEGYPKVVDTFYRGSELPWENTPEPRCHESWRRLLRALAYGALEATSTRYKLEEERDASTGGLIIDPNTGYPRFGWRISPWPVPMGAGALSVTSIFWGDGTLLSRQAPAVAGPIIEDGETYHVGVTVSTADLMRVFPPRCEAPSPLPDVNAAREITRRGAPPKWPREMWLERVAVLALAGRISLEPGRLEADAEEVAAEVEKASGKRPSVDHVKKDWLRPLLKEARDRAGGK